jgi:carbon-monoxide dehydrogenase medium subunit
MKPAAFEYHAPGSVDEAVALLADHGEDAKILAGGQSLGPMLNMRLATPSALIDLRRVGELDFIDVSAGGELVIGAMTRQRDVERSPIVGAGWPLLTQAVRYVGHIGIRNRGTFGGSIAHADPAAELPAAALALGAKVTLRGTAGERSIDAADLFVTFLTTVLEPDEVLVEIRLPRPAARSGHCWLEYAPRHGDYALVGVAATVALGAYGTDAHRTAEGTYTDASLAYSGVAGMPMLSGAARGLIGAAPGPEIHDEVAAAAAAALEPTSDLFATAPYKRHLVRVLTRRALDAAAARARNARRAAEPAEEEQ